MQQTAQFKFTKAYGQMAFIDPILLLFFTALGDVLLDTQKINGYCNIVSFVEIFAINHLRTKNLSTTRGVEELNQKRSEPYEMLNLPNAEMLA